MGRLELGLKRVDRLIKIWSVLEPEFSEWEFVIVGDGDYRYFYEAMCRNLGLKNTQILLHIIVKVRFFVFHPLPKDSEWF